MYDWRGVELKVRRGEKILSNLIRPSRLRSKIVGASGAKIFAVEIRWVKY